jgi:hypothetical protein
MKSRLDSLNFLTSILTLIFAALAVWNIDINLDPNETASAILNQNWEFIVQMAVPSLITIVLKITKGIKEKTIEFGKLLQSPNFITQAITVGAMVLVSIGIMIPENAPVAITNAIFSGTVITLIGALITNVINPIWHFITDKKN